MMRQFYEFFAGGGLARAGLGSRWTCRFANDIDVKKGASYIANWGRGEFHLGDVAHIAPGEVPGIADLAWASFPCQDLSLAGSGAGLRGRRSGTFWPFWRLMQGLAAEGRAPTVVVLENVCGMLTSHGGRDFTAIAVALAEGGYCFGALVVDAADFLPQSRPRLFLIAVRAHARIPRELMLPLASAAWTPAALSRAVACLPAPTNRQWLWWNLPPGPRPTATLTEIIDSAPQGPPWHSPAQTARLLGMMSPVNLRKVRQAQMVGVRQVGTVYRRTRRDETGARVQRAEVRFDGLAGCLRTPQGGSSRQTVLVVDGSEIRSRLLVPRETARLMGLPDTYRLPSNYNEAYHIAGDGVAVPVVRHLAQHLLEPLLKVNAPSGQIAA